jgi:DNA topoisomerase I
VTRLRLPLCWRMMEMMEVMAHHESAHHPRRALAVSSVSAVVNLPTTHSPRPTTHDQELMAHHLPNFHQSPANQPFPLESNKPMAASPAIVETAEDAGLHYVTDSLPGITRHRHGSGFTYRRSDGSRIRSAKELDRIRKLAIPPAYRNVWICPDPDGHLQATGIDARGRKQYRYHPRFREVRDEDKFKRMLVFGTALRTIRAQVARDLAKQGLPKRKVVAVVVYLLEKSLIRVGNHEYAEANQSFGLTTMLTRHVRVHGQKIEFNFLGKSKVRHRIEIHDPRLARVIRRIQDLPGQELFHYLSENGEAVSISSADVNAYLRDVGGEQFTAKDFRTWWGSLLALMELSMQEPPASQAAAKRAVSTVMKAVAKQLGNTPAICRKSYVHPAVVRAFREGALAFDQSESQDSVDEMVASAEKVLLKLLRQFRKEVGSVQRAA